jgi:preprotein translocase subunit SecD
MSQKYVNLIIILVLMAFVIWVDVPGNGGIHLGSFSRDLETKFGLDLKGGMQILWEADLPANQTITTQSLNDAKGILQKRSNGLGVSEINFTSAGGRRILGEFPGFTNLDEVTKTLEGVGLLEFVDFGDTPMNEGTVVKTDYSNTGQAAEPTPSATATANPNGPTPTPGAATDTTTDKVWHTIMTGDQLQSISPTTDQLGKYIVQFALKADGQKIFADYTTNNVGKYLGIVLDKKVISAPRVNSAITQGSGIIEGNFTYESANTLAIQLRYGSLPIPLKIIQSQIIGPSLGQDSLTKSLLACAIGFAIVFLFLVIYYRLPGFIGFLTIACYATITYAIYKLVPVTLSLPGIAGFLLSTGSALDANILIFERLKEELRAGRTLIQAVDLAWKRAWPSIRDSNIATMITSLILLWFGSQNGATIVQGFAFTLIFGVIVSVFSAYLITRTLLTFSVGWVQPATHEKWFGA